MPVDKLTLCGLLYELFFIDLRQSLFAENNTVKTIMEQFPIRQNDEKTFYPHGPPSENENPKCVKIERSHNLSIRLMRVKCH